MRESFPSSSHAELYFAMHHDTGNDAFWCTLGINAMSIPFNEDRILIKNVSIGKGKGGSLDIERHLQTWTAALYNLGSGSWLALTVVPRRKLAAAHSPR